MPFEATVAIPYFTGIPTDVIVNTFTFNYTGGTPPTSTEFIQLELSLKAFYNGVFTSSSSAGLAPWVNNGATVFKIYNLNDPSPRTPVYHTMSSWPMTAATSATNPPEMALCLSFQGAVVSGVNQARRRGRIFVGGLGNVTTPGDSSHFPIPNATFTNNMATSASTLLSATAADDWAWVVRSRVGGTYTPVTNGWVDNAFDTQRRRGNAPSARQTWT